MPPSSTDIGRVVLIIPPSVFLLDERVFMALGVLKVAAALERVRPVDVLDLSGIENFEDVVKDYLASSKTNLIGLTATTPQIPAVYSIVKTIRQYRPEAKIILGGSHPTLVNAAYRKEEQKGLNGRATKALQDLLETFDVTVMGDGELAVHLALEPGAPKIIDADIPTSNLFLKNETLDELPWPARHLVDVDSYHYFIEGERALSLIAQLGCPFNCGFCGGRSSPFLRRVRTRSVQKIVAEVEHLYERYGVKGFMFYDDELNVSKTMVELMNSLTDLQNKHGTEFRLRGFVKAQLFTDEQADAMYRAGFRWILTGFESGSPRILSNINKRSTREENTRCVDIAKRYGLKVKALMSIGHPGESEETIMQTHDWLLGVEPDDFDVTIITVYPGAPYYDDAVPHQTQKGIWTYTYNGDNLHNIEIDYRKVAGYFKGDPDGGYESFVFTDFLAREDIVRLRGFLERDIRERLKIPFNPSVAASQYEHSMGQFGKFPSHILKSTNQ